MDDAGIPAREADQVEAFIAAATFENGRLTRGEPGNLRFHVLQHTDDPAHFLLLKVYQSQQNTESHWATENFARWQEAPAEMFVEPGEAIRYRPVFPAGSDWFS